jgi:DNA replication protein DnaC
MAYGKDIYQTAFGILNDRRMREDEAAEERRRVFYTMYPRAQEIERLLTATAIGAAKAVLNGGNTVTELTRLKEKNLSLQQELSQILRGAGLEPDYLTPHYQCAKCEDTGYIDGRMCSCLRDLLRRTAYQRLNEMTPLSLCSFEDFSLRHYPESPQNEGEIAPKKQMENIFHFCRTYARDFSLKSPSLILQGGTGLGKTHLSLAIAREAVGKGFGTIYLSAQNMATSLERERFGRAEEDENTNELLIGCDLFILDDLGTEFSTSFIDAAIYNIVNTRLMAGRPTIISTNLSLYELQKRYSERFVSRIIGSYVRLTFLGKDVRQQKRMKRD